MKKLAVVLLVLFGYWLDGYRKFSDDHVRRFLVEQNLSVFQGKTETACEAFSDDVDVDIVDRQPAGHWEVQGGKEQICAYLRQAAASFVVLGARVDTAFDNVEIRRSGFPWRTAEVSYRERTTITGAGNGLPIPTMIAVSEDRMTLKRTLGGLRITRLEAKSRTRAK